MTGSMPFKDICLQKYHNQNPLDLINRKLLIHKQLEKPPRNYAVYSDLHGSYDKFLHWLKNGLGFYKIVVQETMGESYSRAITECYEQLLYVINRARFEAIEQHIESDEVVFNVRDHFFEPVPVEFCKILDRLEEFGLTKRRVLLDCVKLLREVTRDDERRITKLVPQHYQENILKLYHHNEEDGFSGLLKGVVSSPIIYQFICSLVVRLVVFNVFDKHINLGDTFDRGESADKLIKLYRAYFGDSHVEIPMHYIWGNHDILWMGAAIGNPILCLEALRITIRYNNHEFLGRYGFNLEKLRKLAFSTYKLRPEGSYIKNGDFPEAEAEAACKMTKTLMMLQMKMTLAMLDETIKTEGDIDFSEEHERHKRLLAMIPTGVSEDSAAWTKFKSDNPLFIDCFFPSVDPKNPSSLTPAEKEVVDDLVAQFTSLQQLQHDIHWLFDRGEAYRVVDHTLYFHAAIPAESDYSLVGINNRSGKELLDFIQDDIKRVGRQHFAKESISLRDSMLFWYLWCGRYSPFFAKGKMATLERAIFDKDIANDDPLTTHAEHSNPFYKHIRHNSFLNKLLEEFHAEKICIGHTPIKTVQQAILSESIRAFIVDGGASAAYGDRGVVLIYTPEYSYLTFHPCLEDLIKAEQELRLPDIKVQKLEERGRLKLRDLEKGFLLEKELEAIDELLHEKLPSFSSAYFVPKRAANPKGSAAKL